MAASLWLFTDHWFSNISSCLWASSPGALEPCCRSLLFVGRISNELSQLRAVIPSVG